MQPLERRHWIAAAAHRLRFRWRTVAPEDLEQVADSLWQDSDLRDLDPDQAVAQWLAPIGPAR